MLGRRLSLVVCVAAALAQAGETPAEKGPTRVVVVQDKTPVLFEQNQIGELAEGTRLEVRQRYAGWVMVRAQLGPNWFIGWVREAAVAPDSLANVDIKVAPTRPTTAYRRPDTRRLITPPAGNDFTIFASSLNKSASLPGSNSRVFMYRNIPALSEKFLVFSTNHALGNATLFS